MGLFSSIGSFFSPVLGGLGSSIGGIVDDALGMSSQNKANAQKQANYNQQMGLAFRQQQFNEDYAKNMMQWRVEDAQKAGVHPMAALGLSSPSLGSVTMPSDIATYNPVDMGQSTNYAATKAKDRKQQATMVGLQMRGMELDNEYKQAQIDALKVDTLASSIASNQALESPALPPLHDNRLIPGQGDAPPPSGSNSPFLDKPIVRDGWLLDENGHKVGIIPSDAAAQRFEDKLILEWVPFAGSAVRSFRGKFLGQKVNGHWWHGEDKGFLPYPPKKEKGFYENARGVMRFYSDYDN